MKSRSIQSPVGTSDVLSVLQSHKKTLKEDLGLNGLIQGFLFDEDMKLKQSFEVPNLITDYGDQYYASKGAAIATTAVTGMKLGTGGATAAAKNGAGANIVTYNTALTASKAIDATFPTAATKGAGLGWRITWQTTWAAGESTQNSISEVVLTNQSALADTAGVAGDKISRATFTGTVVNKGANDTLIIQWLHDFLGA